MQCAVIRTTLRDYVGPYELTRIHVQEALDSYTIRSAGGKFRGEREGQIAEGMMADLSYWSESVEVWIEHDQKTFKSVPDVSCQNWYMKAEHNSNE